MCGTLTPKTSIIAKDMTFFKAKNISLDKGKMRRLLLNADKGLTDLFLKKPDTSFHIAWRQFNTV
jgi:hypothetical protein